jgi:hypothetical protein
MVFNRHSKAGELGQKNTIQYSIVNTRGHYSCAVQYSKRKRSLQLCSNVQLPVVGFDC